jgi:hypothetical protein
MKLTAEVEEMTLDYPVVSPLRSMLAALHVRFAHLSEAVRSLAQTREVTELSH